MIDINELRDRAATFGSDYLTDEEWVEVISRLEAAEKERDELRSSMKFRTSLIGRTEAERGLLSLRHGVNCYVRTFDKDTIEVRESVYEVMALLVAAHEVK